MSPAPSVAFASAAEVETLIADFERASVSRERWTHHAHIAVAVWNLLHYEAAEALVVVRDGILRLNEANGVPRTPTGGYHETLTRFYMWAVGEALAEIDRTARLDEVCNAVIARCGDRKLPLRYYTQPVLMSWTARTSWVEPDVRALDSL